MKARRHIPSTPFSKLPYEVLSDKHLTSADKVTYAAMASEVKRAGVNIVSWQHVELSEITHLSARQVSRSIERLARSGYISTALDKINSRPTYWLKSEVFQRQKPKLIELPKAAQK